MQLNNGVVSITQFASEPRRGSALRLNGPSFRSHPQVVQSASAEEKSSRERAYQGVVVAHLPSDAGTRLNVRKEPFRNESWSKDQMYLPYRLFLMLYLPNRHDPSTLYLQRYVLPETDIPLRTSLAGYTQSAKAI